MDTVNPVEEPEADAVAAARRRVFDTADGGTYGALGLDVDALIAEVRAAEAPRVAELEAALREIGELSFFPIKRSWQEARAIARDALALSPEEGGE